MLTLDLRQRASKFMQKLPPKHRRQISEKILALQNDPLPHDSERLTGFFYWRADVGEYRIIYRVEASVLFIPLIGKRNDDEVYKRLKRMGG